MEITISHARYAPTWTTLERLLREVTNQHDGCLTRVARKDNRCDYRAPGVYNLGFQHDDITLPIKLTVEGIGGSSPENNSRNSI